MNRNKLARRIKHGQQIAERWRLRRWVEEAYRNCVLNFYCRDVPNRFTYLGPEGLYEGDYNFPGGLTISNNITLESQEAGIPTSDIKLDD